MVRDRHPPRQSQMPFLNGQTRHRPSPFLTYRAGLAIVCIGLVSLAMAGIIREREQTWNEADTKPLLSVNEIEEYKLTPAKRSFSFGLIVCLLSGVFSSMLNLAIAFGACVSRLRIRCWFLRLHVKSAAFES